MRRLFNILIITIIVLTSCKKDDNNNNNPNLVASSCNCEELEQPFENEQIVEVSSISELYDAINNANTKTTIFLADGTYTVSSSQFIYITNDNITIRSKSGNRDNVIIEGEGMNAGGSGHGILVAASNFTVADLTIRDVQNHGVQIQGENDADNCLIHNVKFVNINEQMIKISKGNNTFSDNGIVECCYFEFTAGQANQYYTGGVDGHKCINWIVRNNTFKNIKSPETSLCEHAVHFWSESENTLVENNLIINCDRGIGFGLGNSSHIGGVIRNNMIHTSRDVGIGLENASSVKVYNNTLHTENYSNSIEYRFSGSNNIHIVNNLSNAEITEREGGSANLETNFEFSDFSLFVDAVNHNYKLASVNTNIVDKGTDLNEVKTDFECDNRPQAVATDIGADEFTEN